MSTSEQQLAVPDDLAAAQTKLVYLCLRGMGESTVTDLQQRLKLPKLTLLTILEVLSKKDHVDRTDVGYTIR